MNNLPNLSYLYKPQKWNIMANISNFSTGAYLPSGETLSPKGGFHPSAETLLKQKDCFPTKNYHPLIANPFLLISNSFGIQEDTSSQSVEVIDLEDSKVVDPVPKKRKVKDLTSSVFEIAEKPIVIKFALNAVELVVKHVRFYEYTDTFRKNKHSSVLLDWIYSYGATKSNDKTYYKGDIYNTNAPTAGVVIYTHNEVLPGCFILKKASFFQNGDCNGEGIIECKCSIRGIFTIDVYFSNIDSHYPNIEQIFYGPILKDKNFKRINPHYFLDVE